MKKLILILVCAVLMVGLISLNYLLWDKEKSSKSIANLKYSNESKDASIDVLGNEIKKSKDTIDDFAGKVSDLEYNNKKLLDAMSELRQEQSKADEVLKQKNILIDQLKAQMDIKPFETLFKQWAEKVDKGDYVEAYELMKKDADSEFNTLNSFSGLFQGKVKNFKIKSVKLETESGFSQGKIVFLVTLDIKLDENSGAANFTNGLNDRYLLMDYDQDNGKWLISKIAASVNSVSP